MKDSFLNGEYDNLGSLGEGGYARVILARHRDLGYVRALKIQDRMVDGEDDPLFVKFKEECATLLRLGNGCHPNIVRMYQFGLLNGHAFAEMDYVDGTSLYNYMKGAQDAGLPWEEVFRLTSDIASALAYCHVDIYRYLMDREADELESDPDDGQKILISEEKRQELIRKYRIIHNDVHSNNVMRRNYDGHYVLLDFGLCIQGQTKAGVRSSQRKNGACEYISPEKSSRILNGTEEHNAEVLPQEDVYSLGIIIYEAVTGRPPFYMRHDSDAERLRVIRGHLNVDADQLVAQLKQKRSDTPEWLCNVLRKCLQKTSGDRYEDAGQLLEDVNKGLKRLQEEEMEKATEQLNETIANRDSMIVKLQNEVATLQTDWQEEKEELNKAVEEREAMIKGLIDANETLKKSRQEEIWDTTKKMNEAIEKREKIISNLKKELSTLNTFKAEPQQDHNATTAPQGKSSAGLLNSLILALSFVGCLPAACSSIRNELWVPAALFLGLACLAVYIIYNIKEQGSGFMKAITTSQFATFSLVAATAYKDLQQQMPEICVYLATGGLSILAGVIMNFIKPSNSNEK